MVKRLSLFSYIIAFCIFLSSCDDTDRYFGEYVAYNSVATNSILGIYSKTESKLFPIEEDSYGRCLFFYMSYTLLIPDRSGSTRICGILICQKYNNKYCFYYSDDNFILYQSSITPAHTDDEYKNEIYERFSPDELNSFKEKNDWENPIDESKSSKAPIARKTLGQTKQLIPKDKLQDAYNQILTPEDISQKTRFIYLTSDNYNRRIYFLKEVISYSYLPGRSFAVMFSKDGALIDYVEIKDAFNYQDDLKEFKAKNGWNNPVE